KRRRNDTDPPGTVRKKKKAPGSLPTEGGRRLLSSASAKLQAALSIPPLDHRDLVAGLVVVDLVHESADQEQAAAADPVEVARVGRVGQLRRVEAGALVADDVDRLGRRLTRRDVDAPRQVRLLAAALLQQRLEPLLVLLLDLRRHLQVAVLHGVEQRL